VIELGASLPSLVALGTSSTSDVDGSPVPGNGFHTRFVDDLGALAAHGITHLRLGFDWSRLQPRSGMGDELNGEWVEWYRDVLSAARASGIEVWAGLLERHVPRWFDDERGFRDTKTADRYWPRFVEASAGAFGDLVAGWFPIDDPIGYAARLEPDDVVRHGEVVDIMVRAWRDSWRVLRGGPPVAGSFAIRTVRPADDSGPAAEAARREDHLRWRTFLRGLRDGTLVIPGRADREIPDLAGAIDIVGVRLRTDLGSDTGIDDESLRRWQERAAMMLHRVTDEGPDLPIAVAAYRVSRSRRSETARDAEVLTEATKRAVDHVVSDGIPIKNMFVEPGIAASKATQESAFLDWDRHPTPLASAWTR